MDADRYHTNRTKHPTSRGLNFIEFLTLQKCEQQVKLED